ncbi:MAG: hypothetical protein JO250_19395 [Armatimonadetes bacterium]|nr:hypothetical protein [Armatimonadota bacterium]
MSSQRAFLPLAAGLVLLAAAASAAPPRPDFTNLPAYIRALNQSRDLQAVAIRQEIADGPAGLARQRAATEAAGIPLDLRQAQPPVPPDRNAALLWEKWDALRRGHVRLPNYAETLSAGYAYTPEQLARVQQVFDENREAMDILRQAAEKPALAFPDEDFLHYAGLREAARELKTESYLLATQGRYADAVADQALGFGIAKQIASRPTLINYLVGNAIEAITLGSMKDILYLAGPNAAVDAQVQQTIPAARPVLSLKRALTGEVSYSLAQIEKMRSASPAELASLAQAATDPSGNPPQVKIKTFTPEERRFVNNLLDAVEAEYLSQMRRLVSAADAPGPARRAVFASVQATFPDPTNPVHTLNPTTQWNQILLPVFGRMDENDNRLHAQEQVTMAGAALLAEKGRTGAFPAALPGDFLDPFTGKPLGYRREGDNGFVVYSVGPDGKFNGGRPGEYIFPLQAFFRYPGPTPKPVPTDMLK